MAMLDELEEAIEALKVAFERYFHGVDKVPPTRDHDEIKRSVRLLMTSPTGTTAVRFRLQNLKARLVTYEHYWTRVLNQIERGTFRRVLAESERRELIGKRKPEPQAASNDGPAGEVSQPTADADADADAADVVQQRPRAASRSATAPRAALPEGVDAKEVRELFKQFVEAKRAAGEPTAGLTYGKLLDKLSRELPQLRAKHGADIRFEVATVEGKVRLRARSRGASNQKAS